MEACNNKSIGIISAVLFLFNLVCLLKEMEKDNN